MKPIFVKIAMVMFLFTGMLSAQQKNASGDNEFLMQAFKSRMIATDEAKLASKKATSPVIRQYAGQLVKEENTLYSGIKKLGAARNIAFPKSIGYIDTQSRGSLAKAKGAAFDRKYVAMLTADLQKDISIYTQAATSSDTEISSYARKSLPMLQAQLAAVRTLK